MLLPQNAERFSRKKCKKMQTNKQKNLSCAAEGLSVEGEGGAHTSSSWDPVQLHSSLLHEIHLIIIIDYYAVLCRFIIIIIIIIIIISDSLSCLSPLHSPPLRSHIPYFSNSYMSLSLIQLSKHTQTHFTYIQPNLSLWTLNILCSIVCQFCEHC